MRVEFATEGRRGPLTVGQSNMLWISENLPEVDLVQSLVVPLPDGVTLPMVGAVLRDLMIRHESLRTLFLPRESPQQVVQSRGALTVGAYDADGGPDVSALLHRGFDLAELPLRAAVLVRRGRPVELVLKFSHLAVDLLGVRVVERELHERFGAGRPPCEAVPTRQPIDQAQ